METIGLRRAPALRIVDGSRQALEPKQTFAVALRRKVHEWTPELSFGARLIKELARFAQTLGDPLRRIATALEEFKPRTVVEPDQRLDLADLVRGHFSSFDYVFSDLRAKLSCLSLEQLEQADALLIQLFGDDGKRIKILNAHATGPLRDMVGNYSGYDGRSIEYLMHSVNTFRTELAAAKLLRFTERLNTK